MTIIFPNFANILPIVRVCLPAQSNSTRRLEYILYWSGVIIRYVPLTCHSIYYYYVTADDGRHNKGINYNINNVNDEMNLLQYTVITMESTSSSFYRYITRLKWLLLLYCWLCGYFSEVVRNLTFNGVIPLVRANYNYPWEVVVLYIP